MKFLLILALVCTHVCANAQNENNVINKPTPIEEWVVSPTGPNDLSKDSLDAVYQYIDALDEFEISKAHEALRYRLIKNPTQQNKELVLYIEQKLNGLK